MNFPGNEYDATVSRNTNWAIIKLKPEILNYYEKRVSLTQYGATSSLTDKCFVMMNYRLTIFGFSTYIISCGGLPIVSGTLIASLLENY